jgi:hypothetical protein
MKTDLQLTNQHAIIVEYRLQQICPGCGRCMNLSRVINWPDGEQSPVFECRRCLIAVNEPPFHQF